jgi:alpha-N-acetylglucosamine transferase
MVKFQRNRRGKFAILGVVLLPVFIGVVLLFTVSFLFDSSSSPLALSDFQDSKSQKTSAATTETTTKAANGHHCLNKDFQPQHKASVWTMLNGSMTYVRGAVKMGKSIRAHTKTPLDLVVMELESKPLGEEAWKELKEVGFIKCSVSSIPPPDAAKTRQDLREKFAVLHVWAMEVYDTVLFLDADTFAQNGVDDLIHMDLKGKPLGVTKDIRNKKWVDTFNSGVMVLHPSQKEHDRLLTLLRSGMEFEYVMSDQGFLNAVYKENWHEIGFVNNANLALYRFQRDFWDQHKLEDINVIHYTMLKPWKCVLKGAYRPVCEIWINAK